MAKITFWADAGRICFRMSGKFEDFQAFVQSFKDAVPWQQRRWNPIKDRKTGKPSGRGDNSWDFDSEYLDRVRQIATQLGLNVEVVSAETPPASDANEEDAYRQMFQKLSTENLRKIYLMLAKAYHPDRNPVFAEVMTAINAGWGRVQEEREAKV